MSEQPLEASREPMPIKPSGLRDVFVILRGIAGGVVGGAIGFVVVRWLAQQNMYGMMIPGAMIGLGASLAARRRSVVLGVVCAAAAVVLAIVAEGVLFPFRKDDSFSFFLGHLHHLRLLTMFMIGAGAAFAFWLGQGR